MRPGRGRCCPRRETERAWQVKPRSFDITLSSSLHAHIIHTHTNIYRHSHTHTDRVTPLFPVAPILPEPTPPAASVCPGTATSQARRARQLPQRTGVQWGRPPGLQPDPLAPALGCGGWDTPPASGRARPRRGWSGQSCHPARSRAPCLPYERRSRPKEQDAWQLDSSASRSAPSFLAPSAPEKQDATAALRLRGEGAGATRSPGIRSPRRLRVPPAASRARE